MTDVEYLDSDDADFRLADGWAERLTEVARKAEAADPRDARAVVEENIPEEYANEAVIGEGSGRVVARLPDEAIDMTREREHVEYVVKFPKQNDPGLVGQGGVIQNGEEAAVWKETESEYLLPVTAHHSERWWLIMPRADPVLQCERSEVVDWEQDARDALEDYVARDDIYEENIGWMHPGLVLMDYGTASMPD